MKNLLITGCSGFIGSHIAKKAVEDGYHVIGIDIKPFNIDGVESRICDITDRNAIERALDRDIDAIIHLAAITVGVEFEKDMQRCYNINVSGFVNILDAALRKGCKNVLYASSAYVYFDRFLEDSQMDPKRQRNHYAKSKMINEMVADSYADAYGIKTTGLRYFNVYGDGENSKGDYTSIITKFLEMNKKGEQLLLYGDGTQAKDLIHIDDVSKITMKLLEASRHPIYNVGTGRALAYKDIATMINKDKIKCIKNPLSTYQTFSKADTSRLLETIGNYNFIKVEDWISEKLDENR